MENKISYDVRGAAFKVHNTLGPGLLESVYESALSHELLKMNYQIQNQLGIPMKYDTIEFKFGFRLDILVNNLVIIEVKSADTLLDVHHKQLLTYLRLTDKRLGLLINFNSSTLKGSIIRIVNNL